MMILVLTLLTSWWLINWLNKPGNFSFKKIELINQLHNQESKELTSIAAKALNGGFFSLNIEQFKSEFLTQLPWVKSVAIRKIWPDKLLLEIVEHKPVARWLSVDKNMPETITQLLSQQGHIFTPDLSSRQKKKFMYMALLTGTKNNAQQVLKNCVQFNQQLKLLNSGIKQCGMNKRRSWRIKLFTDNNVAIKLGKKNITAHLERFIKAFSGPLKIYLKAVDIADLRYANGFSIKWKQVNLLPDTAQQHTFKN